MNRASVILACGLSLGVSAVSFAEPPAPAATPAASPAVAPPASAPAPAATPDTKTEPKKDGAPATYPAYVTKKLWADNDLRGKQAPKLNVEAWHGVKEPETKGKTMIVDFWGISCRPCQLLIPELEAWQEKFKDDLVVIGLTSETPKALDNFEDVRGGKIKYAIAIDSRILAYKEVGVQGIPHVLVISSDGVVRWQGFPQSQEDTLTEATLKQIIDADKAARAKTAKPETAAAPKPAADAKPDEKAPPKKS